MAILLNLTGAGDKKVQMNRDSREGPKLPKSEVARQRLLVTGVVQGVGFRPFVYGLALDKSLCGFVGNDSAGVFIEIEGPAEALASFHQELVGHPPPLAIIESVTSETIMVVGESSFRIVHSQSEAAHNTLISPDICICEECISELFDVQNRRFAYPFINCTNCGPRFSIIKDIPYDRPFTTMADFTMCANCQREYEDPLDRRFHAQPNACPVCGPNVWLEIVEDQKVHLAKSVLNAKDSSAAIEAARQLLSAGKTIAVKGLGGFHLACDAMNDGALERLRERKGRVDKPFAVMAADLASIREFAVFTPEEAVQLTSKERPILLLRKRAASNLSGLVAPGNQYVGVMLPYTPLHYLLLHGTAGIMKSLPLQVLVMTSGNYSNEPIVKDNKDARERLSSLADALLMNNRKIHARCDDSVIRIVGSEEGDTEVTKQSQKADQIKSAMLPIRRSRGYAPFPVRLPLQSPPILAVGGELKATFCLANGNYGYMSQHIGDMENLETLLAFESAVNHFQSIFRIEPKRIACDLHPRYLASRWAQQRWDDLPVVKVQHHHAHIASLMAEHQLDGSQPLIGFSFDGTGYGPDGAVWGGEVLICDYSSFTRASHLKYVPLVGGDAAIKRPYRLALSQLWAAGIDWNENLPSVAAGKLVELELIRKQLDLDMNTVPTSSMGRLFDAVASLCGLRQTITYEAQAAMELEAVSADGYHGSYEFEIDDDVFNAAPVIHAISKDVVSGVDTAVISARFHRAVAELVLALSSKIRKHTGLSKVGLSGGVFQNVTLLTQTTTLLQRAGFTLYCHRLIPPNDGGLALGQAIIAAASS